MAGKLSAKVRQAGPLARTVDLEGEISSDAEKTLSAAYAEAVEGGAQTIILNFSGVSYMNSFGIGILTMLIIRAQRDRKRIVGYGLTEHYRRIFTITRLDQVIPIHDSEEVSLAYAEPYDLPERGN